MRPAGTTWLPYCAPSSPGGTRTRSARVKISRPNPWSTGPCPRGPCRLEAGALPAGNRTAGPAWAGGPCGDALACRAVRATRPRDDGPAHRPGPVPAPWRVVAERRPARGRRRRVPPGGLEPPQSGLKGRCPSRRARAAGRRWTPPRQGRVNASLGFVRGRERAAARCRPGPPALRGRVRSRARRHELLEQDSNPHRPEPKSGVLPVRPSSIVAGGGSIRRAPQALRPYRPGGSNPATPDRVRCPSCRARAA